MIKIYKLREPHREYLKVNEENFEGFIEKIDAMSKSYFVILIGIKLKENWKNIRDEFRSKSFNLLFTQACLFGEKYIYKFFNDFSISKLKRKKNKDRYFKKLFTGMKAEIICFSIKGEQMKAPDEFMPVDFSIIGLAIDKFIELFAEVEIELLCLNIFDIIELLSVRIPLFNSLRRKAKRRKFGIYKNFS
ncbi:MAG: hypothetical protein AB1633_05805 [Elusimicrobiota bacterium]